MGYERPDGSFSSGSPGLVVPVVGPVSRRAAALLRRLPSGCWLVSSEVLLARFVLIHPQPFHDWCGTRGPWLAGGLLDHLLARWWSLLGADVSVGRFPLLSIVSIP